MDDVDIKAALELGAQLAVEGQEMILGMRIWKLKGLEIPEPRSPEYQQMIEAGRKLLDSSNAETPDA